MSHVDEGLIHAYIDGAFPPGNQQGEEIDAHMALCVDCRVRMEKARELKERAQVVMHRLAPDAIVTPPFEEILARREHTRVAASGTFGPSAAEPRPASPRSRRRSDVFPIPFAWAATLILAVGAGWMGREIMLNRQAIGADSEAEQSVPVSADADAASSLQSEAGAAAPQAAVADAGAGGGQERAGARNEAEQVQERPREAVTGIAPPVAQLKATDSAMRREQAVAGQARVDSVPIVLSGIETVAARAATERRMLSASVSTVTVLDSTNRSMTAGPLLVAYVRASAESRWTAEPFATYGLIGYERIARLDELEPIRSERAVVDSVEMLRTFYAMDGDTVEMVQQLEQTALMLEEVVVTGALSAADSARRRADSLAAGRQSAPATAPPPAVRADRERRALELAAEVLDTASMLESRNVVTVRHSDRLVLLLGSGTRESLEALATRIR